VLNVSISSARTRKRLRKDDVTPLDLDISYIPYLLNRLTDFDHFCTKITCLMSRLAPQEEDSDRGQDDVTQDLDISSCHIFSTA